VLAGDAGVVAVSIRSGERAPRACDHIARSATQRLRQGGGLPIDSRVHGSTPPCRASAPPRSSTAKAVSERPALASRSCPLRAVGSVRSAPADAPAEPGSTPGPSASARRRGWPVDAPRADARARTPRSTRLPTRTVRRRPAPARIHDIVQIDLPSAAAPARSGWTRAAIRRTFPRGARAAALTAKARVARPGPSPSPSRRSTSSPPLTATTAPDQPSARMPHVVADNRRRHPCTACHRPSTGIHTFSVSPPRLPLGPPAPDRAAHTT
jgi:hypothetical protein